MSSSVVERMSLELGCCVFLLSMGHPHAQTILRTGMIKWMWMILAIYESQSRTHTDGVQGFGRICHHHGDLKALCRARYVAFMLRGAAATVLEWLEMRGLMLHFRKPHAT